MRPGCRALDSIPGFSRFSRLSVTFVGDETMSTKAEIKELAMAVDGGLSAYVSVHDKIFNEGATLKSLFKNLIGRGTPMAALLADAEKLVLTWEAIAQQIESFRASRYSSLPHDERNYLEILSRYVAALQRTVATLVDRQRLANEGSKGGPNNPMTWNALKQREAAYQEVIRDYTAIGQELKVAAHIIFS